MPTDANGGHRHVWTGLPAAGFRFRLVGGFGFAVTLRSGDGTLVIPPVGTPSSSRTGA
jgi:hypothetical protein